MMLRFVTKAPTSGTLRNGQVEPLPLLVESVNASRGQSWWPTPRASDDNGVCWKRAESGQHRYKLTDFVGVIWLLTRKRQPGMTLNPTWTDWFMGLPVGWTE